MRSTINRKVLVIGTEAEILRYIAEDLGESWEITKITGLFDYDRYSARDRRHTLEELVDPEGVEVSSQLLEVRDATQTADLLFVQNNMGAGVDCVHAIPRGLRQRVIVMSTSDLNEREQAPYRKLGVRHFLVLSTSSIETLRQILAGM